MGLRQLIAKKFNPAVFFRTDGLSWCYSKQFCCVYLPEHTVLPPQFPVKQPFPAVPSIQRRWRVHYCNTRLRGLRTWRVLLVNTRQVRLQHFCLQLWSLMSCAVEQGHWLKIQVGKCHFAGGLSRPTHSLQARMLAPLLFAVVYIFVPFESQIQLFSWCLIRGSSFILHSSCRYIILKVLVMLYFNNHTLGLRLTI